MSYNFDKLNGAGNDFIFIKHEDYRHDWDFSKLAIKLCDRHFGIGADGLVIVHNNPQNSPQFHWEFYNSDGSQAEMCGNAARCMIRYLSLQFGRSHSEFKTKIGTVSGAVIDSQTTSVQWSLVERKPQKKTVLTTYGPIEGFMVNTGVPHFVLLNPTHILSSNLYKEIQDHKDFEPTGTNVTDLITNGSHYNTRTFERGVADFTLACGTGVIAAACVLEQHNTQSEYKINAPGGSLHVCFLQNQVTLTGPALWVFSGQISI